MALSAKLQLRQSQSLVMTPQLMQSIKLLQMTHGELAQFIEDEIERNPLLERLGADDGMGPKPDTVADEPDGGDGDWISKDLETSAGTIADRLDTSLENVFPDDAGRQETLSPALLSHWKSAPGTGGQNAGGFPGETVDLEAVAAAEVSLRDHVDEQIAFAFKVPGERMIARELADTLDEGGYMRGDPGEMAERLGCRHAEIMAVLSRCQTFDPPGLFARDLSECLALQLMRRDRFDPAMQAFVVNLDLLARRDFGALSKRCDVDEADLIDMLAEVRDLDPKPGTAFTSAMAPAIVPDVSVSAAADGSWIVELNPGALPRALVNEEYYARVFARLQKKKDKEFLSGCLQDANWLTRSLDQRARTILKVASEIVKQQDAFLVEGIRALRPLNLRTVADAIDMHESTVSRVTANKFMSTPRGIFELRYFFTASIAASGGGEAHSSEAVRHRIRELIEAESVAKVLSDDTIVDILKDSGIEIARRTVAKYREAMSIPSSVERRREKRALAAAGR